VKKVAILQSNYIPWKGYFDLIAAVDEFIIYDDMQFTRRDWRNRNKIKTPQGLRWMTVPVLVKGKFSQQIRATEIDGQAWAVEHWKSLTLNYRRAKYFDEIAEWLEPLYMGASCRFLSDLNLKFMKAICSYLGIKTAITCSWDYHLEKGKTERLASLCRQAGATEYISGPAAQEYIDEQVFTAMGIKLMWFDYTGYPEYPQLWGEFAHGVSILDLLFNCGQSAHGCMKHVGP
jgi:hypothetical protein